MIVNILSSAKTAGSIVGTIIGLIIVYFAMDNLFKKDKNK